MIKAKSWSYTNKIELDKPYDDSVWCEDTETALSEDKEKVCLAYAGFINTGTGDVVIVKDETEYFDFLQYLANTECSLFGFNLNYDLSHLVSFWRNNGFEFTNKRVVSSMNNLISVRVEFKDKKYVKITDISRKFNSGSLASIYKDLGGKLFTKGETPLYEKGKPDFDCYSVRQGSLDDDYKVDHNDIVYLENDLGMTAYLVSKGMELGNKMTSSSDSIEAYKNWFFYDSGFYSDEMYCEDMGEDLPDDKELNKYREFKYKEVFWPSYKEECKKLSDWRPEYEIENFKKVKRESLNIMRKYKTDILKERLEQEKDKTLHKNMMEEHLQDLDIWCEEYKNLEVFDWLQKGYAGGFTVTNYNNTGVWTNLEYNKPKGYEHQPEVIANVSVLDINSSYPFQLSSRLLPYGKPKFYSGKPDFKKGFCYMVHGCLKNVCVKENKTPFLHYVKEHGFSYVYLENSEFVEFYLPLDELIKVFDNYDVEDMIIIDCMEWKGTDKLFKQFVDIHNKRKEEASLKIKELKNMLANKTLGTKEYEDIEDQLNHNAFIRMDAKLKNNQLYGKMGASCFNIKMEYDVDDANGIVHLYPASVKGREVIEYNLSSCNYLAAFVTSWARLTLLECSDKIGWNKVLAEDTDSVIYIDEDVDIEALGIDMDDSRLGAWDKEKDKMFGKFFKPKCYMMAKNKEGTEGKIIKGAGITQRLKDKVMCFDDMFFGKVFEGKLKSFNTEYGKILKESEHRLYYSSAIINMLGYEK